MVPEGERVREALKCRGKKNGQRNDVYIVGISHWCV
jgi:hypothetical protein